MATRNVGRLGAAEDIGDDPAAVAHVHQLTWLQRHLG